VLPSNKRFYRKGLDHCSRPAAHERSTQGRWRARIASHKLVRRLGAHAQTTSPASSQVRVEEISTVKSACGKWFLAAYFKNGDVDFRCHPSGAEARVFSCIFRPG
jgi:hypothetical protein